jgi:hypothetical protein
MEGRKHLSVPHKYLGDLLETFPPLRVVQEFLYGVLTTLAAIGIQHSLHHPVPLLLFVENVVWVILRLDTFHLLGRG